MRFVAIMPSKTSFRTLAFLLGLFLPFGLQAQNSTQSPYSNFGIGELGGGEFSQISAVGGLSQTAGSRYQNSPLNPATLGALRYSNLDFGFHGSSGKITALNKRRDVNSGGFSYLNMAFPTMNKNFLTGTYVDSNGKTKPRFLKVNMGTAFGLSPVSAVGFNYTLTDSSILRHDVYHNGGGGLNRFYLAHAIQIANRLSIGYQAAYLFGQLRDFSVFNLEDSGYFMRFEDQRSILISGWQHRLGVHLNFNTGKIHHLLGGSLLWNKNTTGTQSRLVRTYSSGFGGFPSYKDTILSTVSQQGNITLPDGFAAGYSMERPGKWRIGAEYRQEQWDKFNAFYTSGNFATRSTWGVGLNINPEAPARKKGARNRIPIEWRMGYRSTQTQNQFNTASGMLNLQEQAYTLGVGIPVSRRYFDNTFLRSQLNITLEYLDRGGSAAFNAGLAREQYLRLILGVSLGDVWFDRNKYN
ncbi:MAG: hypothetical protein RL160_1399 [Bacteroidota bacterium]